MQADTETHGCVGKLLGRERDKLERAEKAKADRKWEEAAEVASGLRKRPFTQREKEIRSLLNQ